MIIQNFCSNSCRKVVSEGYQVWKVIILILTVYIHEKIDFSEIDIDFSVTPCEKNWCGRPHPDRIFKNLFDLCVPIDENFKSSRSPKLQNFCYSKTLRG